MTIAWTSAQEEEFLDTTEVKSIDFNTQRVLVDGGMGDGRFYGFEYVRLEDWTDEEGTLHEIIPKTGDGPVVRRLGPGRRADEPASGPARPDRPSCRASGTPGRSSRTARLG